MRILITNDDGINAPGLEVLQAIAEEVAGEGGEVWTVAPAFEQSGVAHATSHAHPTLIARLSDRRYAAEGSPADCVLAGLYDVLADAPPDLVLSGVNRGNNAGENAMYSGTLGAAMEASLQGIRAIALSQFYGPGNRDLDNPYEAAAVHGAGLVRQLLDAAPWGGETYQTFYNVNFPPLPASEVLGPSACAQGLRPTSRHAVIPQVAPNGRRFLWIHGGPQDEPSAPGTDVDRALERYIAVTPMRADLTAHDLLGALEGALK